jgi:hypothetical protein
MASSATYVLRQLDNNDAAASARVDMRPFLYLRLAHLL